MATAYQLNTKNVHGDPKNMFNGLDHNVALNLTRTCKLTLWRLDI